MARVLATAPGAQRGGLTFADVPARLRPSAFHLWLAEVPLHPDHADADHVAAAYGADLEEVEELVARHLPRRPPADNHWRSQIAEAQQWEEYVEWCQEHGLVEAGVNPRSKAAVARAWHWSAFQRWEAQR